MSNDARTNSRQVVAGRYKRFIWWSRCSWVWQQYNQILMFLNWSPVLVEMLLDLPRLFGEGVFDCRVMFNKMGYLRCYRLWACGREYQDQAMCVDQFPILPRIYQAMYQALTFRGVSNPTMSMLWLFFFPERPNRLDDVTLIGVKLHRKGKKKLYNSNYKQACTPDHLSIPHGNNLAICFAPAKLQ